MTFTKKNISMTSFITNGMIDNCPYLVDDDEINPLIQRMSTVERRLNAGILENKSKLNEESLDLNHTYILLADELACTSDKILTIIRDRCMYASIARLQRGKQLLRIRTK